MIDPGANRREALPLPTWKIRPWSKWILYPLLAFPLAIPVLIVASILYSTLGNRGNHAHWDGVYYSASLQQTTRNLREYFHDHPERSALTLEEMTARGLLSKADAHFLALYPHEFVPFTPQTPDGTVVLTIHGPSREPDRLTKRDLTADPAITEPPPAPSPLSSSSSVP